MQWIAFKDQIPELNRLILFGNHRMIELERYHPDHPRIKKGIIAYKDITHWCYVEPPPPAKFASLWSKQETDKEIHES